MYAYTAYGLGLHSALPLPELIPGKARAAVVFRFGKLTPSPPVADDVCYTYWVEGDDVYLYWREVGTFLVRNGEEVIIDSNKNVEMGRLRLFLLGAVMGVILHQRGLLLLHASAIVQNGSASAFIGEKGLGKSSIVAALHAQGDYYLADDIVALDVETPKGPLAYPAFPQFKLWPDTVAWLGENPDDWPLLSSRFAKRDRVINQRFYRDPVPLERVYALAWGPEVKLELLEPREAMMCLVANSYAIRYGQQILHLNRGAHFAHCAKLVKSVPVYRLERPSSLELLKVTAQLVKDHAGEKILLAEEPALS